MAIGTNKQKHKTKQKSKARNGSHQSRRKSGNFSRRRLQSTTESEKVSSKERGWKFIIAFSKQRTFQEGYLGEVVEGTFKARLKYIYEDLIWGNFFL